MSRISVELATSADDADLRRMLRENPMPGAISVSFEREPNYFIGTKVPFIKSSSRAINPVGKWLPWAAARYVMSI